MDTLLFSSQIKMSTTVAREVNKIQIIKCKHKEALNKSQKQKLH